MREPQLQLQVKPTVSLRLTPQMRLSLVVLQKPLLELKAQVEQALAENPFLEAEEDAGPELSLESLRQPSTVPEDDWLRPEEDESAIDTLQARHEFLMSLSTTHISFREYVLTQLHVLVSSPEDLRIGEALVGHLDHSGYLAAPIADIAAVLGVTEEAVTRVLKLIQSFDPLGVGARTLQECLLIQLKARGREGSLAWHVVNEFWDDLGKWRLSHIAKQAGVSLQAVQEAAQEVVSLDPKPGRSFGSPAPPLVPDLSVKWVGDCLEVQCLNGWFPKLKVCTEYRPLLRTTPPHEGSHEALKRKFHEATGLVNALRARERTLETLARALVEEQAAFFAKGPTFLKPLTAKELAKRLGWHESTISRAIAGKCIATPVGVFPLTALFPKKVRFATGEEIVNNHLKERVRELLSQPNGTKRLSDQAVAARLKAQGVSIARRTVTKYRQALGIPSSHIQKPFP